MLGRKLNIFLQWNKFLNDFVGLNYLKKPCRLRTLKRNAFQFWKKKNCNSNLYSHGTI